MGAVTLPPDPRGRLGSLKARPVSRARAAAAYARAAAFLIRVAGPDVMQVPIELQLHVDGRSHRMRIWPAPDRDPLRGSKRRSAR